MLKNILPILGLCAIIANLLQGSLLWREEAKRCETTPKWKLWFICLAGALAALSLVIGIANESRSAAEASASQKALMTVAESFGEQSKQFGIKAKTDEEQIQALRLQLGTTQGAITSLGSQLDQNYKVMQPRLAELEFALTDGHSMTWQREVTRHVFENKASVILMLRNITNVVATDVSFQVEICSDCHPIDDYSAANIYSREIADVPPRWDLFSVTSFEFTVPDGTRTVPVAVAYHCKTCAGNAPVQHLLVHLVPGPDWEPIIRDSHEGESKGHN